MGNINIDIDELARAAQRTVLKKVLLMIEEDKEDLGDYGHGMGLNGFMVRINKIKPKIEALMNE